MENSARQNRGNVEFLTITDFKKRIGKEAAKAQVVKNPNTGKLFLAIEDLRFKVQGDIKQDKDMSVLVPEGDIEQACLVNVTPSEQNVMFTL